MTDNNIDYSRDAECIVCGKENMDDYPACNDCALTAHFPHRQDCIHCFMLERPSNIITETDLDAMARESGQCQDERCVNGTIVGDEYVTHAGDVDNYTWDCSTCNPTPKVYTWDDNTEVPF